MSLTTWKRLRVWLLKTMFAQPEDSWRENFWTWMYMLALRFGKKAEVARG